MCGLIFQADDLKAMLIALSFPKPPAGITAFQLFTKVEKKVSVFSTCHNYMLVDSNIFLNHFCDM